MGIGESIRKTVDNAMADLADNSSPPDDGHVPEPGGPAETIRVHSSISEGANAGESEESGADRSDDAAASDSLAGDLAGKIEPGLAPDSDENSAGPDPQR